MVACRIAKLPRVSPNSSESNILAMQVSQVTIARSVSQLPKVSPTMAVVLRVHICILQSSQSVLQFRKVIQTTDKSVSHLRIVLLSYNCPECPTILQSFLLSRLSCNCQECLTIAQSVLQLSRMSYNCPECHTIVQNVLQLSRVSYNCP